MPPSYAALHYPRFELGNSKLAELDQPTGTSMMRRVANPRVVLWVLSAAALLVPLVLLTVALDDDPFPSQDQRVLDWVADRDFLTLGTISDVISAFTDAPPAAGIGIAVVAFLWLLGATRTALGFAVVGAVVLMVIVLGDRTIAGIVGHTAPSGDDTELSYPSGHVFGATLFYGFWGFLAIYYGLKKKILVPFLLLLVVLILAVGFSRIFEQAHWPSDVAAGYLLGGVWLLLISTAFIYFQKTSWLTSAKQTVDLTTLACDT